MPGATLMLRLRRCLFALRYDATLIARARVTRAVATARRVTTRSTLPQPLQCRTHSKSAIQRYFAAADYAILSLF